MKNIMFVAVLSAFALSSCSEIPTKAVPTPTEMSIPTATLTPVLITTAESAFPESVLTKADYQPVLDLQNDLVKTLPRCEIFKRGSQIAVIGKDIKFFGEEATSDKGKLTMLFTPNSYHNLVDNIRVEDLERQLKMQKDSILVKRLQYFESLQGYRHGNKDIAGYPQISTNPNLQEIMKTLNNLIALNGLDPNIKITPEDVLSGKVDLSTHETPPQELIVVYGSGTEQIKIGNCFEKGLLDNPAMFEVYNGNFNEYYSYLKKSPSGKYILIIATDSGSPRYVVDAMTATVEPEMIIPSLYNQVTIYTMYLALMGNALLNTNDHAFGDWTHDPLSEDNPVFRKIDDNYSPLWAPADDVTMTEINAATFDNSP